MTWLALQEGPRRACRPGALRRARPPPKMVRVIPAPAGRFSGPEGLLHRRGDGTQICDTGLKIGPFGGPRRARVYMNGMPRSMY